MRGKPNEPAYVKYVAEAVAAARGVTFEEISELTAENAERLFKLGR
jgi:TatD DNase family protein